MNQPLHSALPRRALVSNASDAAGYQLYSTALSVIVVTALGFSATQVGLLNALGTMSFLFLVVPIGALVDRIGALQILVLSLLLKSALALSGLAAAAVAPRVVRAFPVRTIFGVGAVVQSGVAALPLVALLVPAAGYVVMGVFSALWAITLTITNIAGGAYAAAAVEPSALGRTAAARRMLTMGAVPISALGGGLLADFAGMIAPLIVWPAVTIAAAALFLLLGRRERRMDGAGT